MRNITTSISKVLLISILTSTIACTDEAIENNEAVLSEAEIPVEIKSYKKEHFPSNEIIRAVKEEEAGETTYEVSLSGAIELEFNQNLNIIDVDGVNELPDSVIQQEILDYVANKYPANYITDWEIEATHQQVELNNDVELEFQLNGDFIREKKGDNDEMILAQNEIPTEIMTYKNAHFPNNDIVRAVKDMDDTETTYELSLEGAYELEFNSNYTIIDIDGVSELPDSVIQQEILDYVAQNYPNNYITDWELEATHQQVELNNDLDLEFHINGDFIRTNNGNDNETVLSDSEIPSEIKTYKNTHFPNNDIVRAVEDKDGVTTYEVSLNGAFELEFNANYAITDIDGVSELPDSVIQQEILDYVAQNYPNNYITSWELEMNHQQVELDNNLDLEFQMNGEFIRIDND